MTNCSRIKFLHFLKKKIHAFDLHFIECLSNIKCSKGTIQRIESKLNNKMALDVI